MDQFALIPESYMLSGDGGEGAGGWGWRALRLLARRSPHFFVHTNNPIGRLPDYLDDMVRLMNLIHIDIRFIIILYIFIILFCSTDKYFFSIQFFF